ncbi:Csm1 protein [Saccharomycopsis crataegensis]|uniref:Csm1 protein n=1 Tax=Saccharomycopsis crataegensis TaxID=43959 RepID=A0AAV5QP28_9ASCO|nr:Csm1 protein [Saccharomycopsis crataegensis]
MPPKRPRKTASAGKAKSSTPPKRRRAKRSMTSENEETIEESSGVGDSRTENNTNLSDLTGSDLISGGTRKGATERRVKRTASVAKKQNSKSESIPTSQDKQLGEDNNNNNNNKHSESNRESSAPNQQKYDSPLDSLIASSLIAGDKSNSGLVEKLISDLNGSKNGLFDNYKKTMEQKTEVSDNLISLLTEKIKTLESQPTEKINHHDEEKASQHLADQQKIAELTKEVEDLKQKLKQVTGLNDESMSNAIILNEKITEYQRTVEKHEIITDILESICGLRVDDVDDSDSNNLTFNCVQGGVNGEISYQLILSRTVVGDTPADSNITVDETVEMVYNPVVENDDDAKKLKRVLPDYFFESLTFPVETLPQFYQKLSRALNKESK